MEHSGKNATKEKELLHREAGKKKNSGLLFRVGGIVRGQAKLVTGQKAETKSRTGKRVRGWTSGAGRTKRWTRAKRIKKKKKRGTKVIVAGGKTTVTRIKTEKKGKKRQKKRASSQGKSRDNESKSRGARKIAKNHRENDGGKAKGRENGAGKKKDFHKKRGGYEKHKKGGCEKKGTEQKWPVLKWGGQKT